MEKNNDKFKNLKSDLKEWVVKDIFPEVQNFRRDIENILSKNDLEKLNQLRIKAKELNKELLNQRIASLEGMRDGNKSLVESSRESIQKIRKDQMELLNELKNLMIPYSDKIKSISETYEPKIENLKNASKKIGKDWYEKNKSNLTDREKAFLKYRMLKKADDIKFFAMKKKMRLAKILLWDGETEIFN
jgi:hypothetical protein